MNTWPASRGVSAFGRAFTLLEMLVAMSVLALIVVLVARLTSGATEVITKSRQHMSADAQARLVFSQMANDFARMPRRKDVDYLFYKNKNTSALSANVAPYPQGANDAMFFNSETPAYYNGGNGTSAKGSVSLIGYRIHNGPAGMPQLERLGENLTWDTVTSNNSTDAASNTNPGGMVFLTPGPNGIPLPASTLAGNWSKTIGTLNGAYADGASSKYQVIGDQVYRLEINFLLTDGSISNIPILVIPPSTWPAGPSFYHPATTDPGSSDDGDSLAKPTSYYAIGSRWYNETTGQGYICTSAAKQKAVWDRIGIQDISAVIVAIAILDSSSRVAINSSNTAAAYSALVTALPDAFDGCSILRGWNGWNGLKYGTPTPYLTNLTASGIPQSASSQVRVYQHYFHLNQN